MFFPLTIFIAISLIAYAAFLKLGARVLRYAVSWKSSLLFAVIIFVVVTVVRLLNLRESPATAIGHWGVMLIGFIIIGGWYFAERGTNADGTPLGWGGGIRLTALAFAIMVIVAFAIALPAQSFLNAHLPRTP